MRLIASVFSIWLMLPLAATAQQELVMVDQAGCSWCETWDAEIGPIYPKTAEGRFAPLRRIDIRAVDDALNLVRRVSFTPTFILVDDGREIARLEGYPGEDFFWGLLARMLRDHSDFEETS